MESVPLDGTYVENYHNYYPMKIEAICGLIYVRSYFDMFELSDAWMGRT